MNHLRKTMYKKIIAVAALFCASIGILKGQSSDLAPQDTIYSPEISYAKPIHKTIASIEIEGMRSFDDFVLRNLSGLAVGDEVLIPGDAMSAAVNRIMRQMCESSRINMSAIKSI